MLRTIYIAIIKCNIVEPQQNYRPLRRSNKQDGPIKSERTRDSQQMDGISLRTMQSREVWQQCSSGLQSAPRIWMDGLMTSNFTSFSIVFQLYQGDGRLIMKGCVQWNSVYGWEDFASSGDRTRSVRSVGPRLTHRATGAPAPRRRITAGRSWGSWNINRSTEKKVARSRTCSSRRRGDHDQASRLWNFFYAQLSWAWIFSCS